MSSTRDQSKNCTSVWIHCNRCFHNYSDKDKTMYILSCYDVVCEKCIIIANKHEIKCLKCKNIVKGHPIGNNLTTNLKELFHPRPWSLKFEKTLSVLKFQTKQRNNFMNGCKKMKDFVKSMSKQRDHIKDECKTLYLLQEKKKKEKTKATAILRKLKQLNLAKKYANRGLEKRRPSTSSAFNFDMERINRRNDRTIPSTCHIMSRSRNEDTFGFPSAEESASTSFYL
ncbi:RING finger protein vilya [Eupeodes corollae]|uniref:RING finger protein vilya n=1 Tax=Eupeodes corollae TaxID=290404 RepID=UPI00248F537A|nr:RING finger protein vilya [Eupeodes corollae]